MRRPSEALPYEAEGGFGVLKQRAPPRLTLLRRGRLVDGPSMASSSIAEGAKTIRETRS